MRIHSIILILVFVLFFGCTDLETSRDNYYTSGQEYLENGDIEEAIIQLTKATKICSGITIAKSSDRAASRP